MHIDIADLVVRRGLRRRKVIDRLAWTIEQFPLTLLGPNGAGKSTLLSVLGGAQAPAAGRVRAEGLDSGSRAWAAMVGIAPQQFRGMRGLTVREVVSYAGWLKGMSRLSAWRASEDAVEVAGLGELDGRPSIDLSGGELRRLALAQAIVHGPALLLLDEIDAGLDAVQRRAVRAAIDRLSGRVSVISATHELVAIPGGEHRVAVIDAGRIVFEGTADAFFAKAPAGTPLHEVAEAAYLAVAGASHRPT